MQILSVPKLFCSPTTIPNPIIDMLKRNNAYYTGNLFTISNNAGCEENSTRNIGILIMLFDQRTP